MQWPMINLALAALISACTGAQDTGVSLTSRGPCNPVPQGLPPDRAVPQRQVPQSRRSRSHRVLRVAVPRSPIRLGHQERKETTTVHFLNSLSAI